MTEKQKLIKWYSVLRRCHYCHRERSYCQEAGACRGELDHQQIMADFAADGVVEVVNIAGYYEVVQ